MRLIDADALKEAVNNKKVVGRFNTIQLIDNAPTVEPDMDFAKECYANGYEDGKNERPQGEWESVGFVSMKYAWCRCSKCHKTTKIYLDSSNEFCCISDIRKKAVACLYCGADMRKGGAE